MSATTTRKIVVKEKNSTFYGIKFDDKYFTWVLLTIVIIQALFNTFGFFFFALNFLADMFVTFALTGVFPANILELQTFPLFIFYIIMVVFLEVTKRNVKGKSRWIVRNFGWIMSGILIFVFFVVPILTQTW